MMNQIELETEKEPGSHTGVGRHPKDVDVYGLRYPLPDHKYRKPDIKIMNAVRAALDSRDLSPALSLEHLLVGVEDGIVYLAGMVMSPESKKRVEELASEINGVYRVESDVRLYNGREQSSFSSTGQGIQAQLSQREE